MADTNLTANKAREFDVTPAIAQAVLKACPTQRCQLIFALARWGGLRCPSEVVLLRWGDIDWEHKKIISSHTLRFTSTAIPHDALPVPEKLPRWYGRMLLSSQ
jgi:integrase